MPEDTSTHFPAAVELTNVNSHGSRRSGWFCMNLFNSNFYFILASQVGAQDGRVTTGNPSHSTTGKTVQIFQYCRQRLLCEPAFQIISTLAQEHACDSYARQDDIVRSYCDKQLPEKRLTTLGRKTPSSQLAWSPSKPRKKAIGCLGRGHTHRKDAFNGNVHIKLQMAGGSGKFTQRPRPDRNGSPRFS